MDKLDILITEVLDELAFKERKKLRVFDFDDTIVKTDHYILIRKNGKVVNKLSPSKFAKYEKKPDEEFDFSDFNKELRSPRLIKSNVNLLRKVLKSEERRTVILTARANPAPVKEFLKSIGINVLVISLGDANPQKKADWIEAQIKGGFTDIRFMDDSDKNVLAVDNLKKKYPNINLKTKLITKAMMEYNIPREQMPQINTMQLKTFVKQNQSNFSIKTVKASDLKKTQRELYSNKIDDVVSGIKSQGLEQGTDFTKKVVISKDGWIIDGHHRWAGIMKHFGPDENIKVIQLNLDKGQALDFWRTMSDKIK